MVGTDRRIIPRRAARFEHTVREGDRLDLLAYRYYRDPTRWWQIADANPEHDFPLDLLDRRPMADEELTLAHRTYFADLEALQTRLAAIATLAPIGDADAPPPDSFSAVVPVHLAALGDRALVLAEIAAAGFRLIRSFAYADEAGAEWEALAVEAPAAKLAWRELLESLAAAPGIDAVVPLAGGATLRLTYNEAVIPRAAVLAAIEAGGFRLVAGGARPILRTGARIAVPPDLAT